MIKHRIISFKVGELGSWWKICKRRHMEYAARIGADYEVLELPASDTPWFERRHCAELIAASERTLYVDADTVISRNAPNVFDLHPPGAIYAALDSTPQDPVCMDRISLAVMAQAILGSIQWTRTYHNIGVVLMDAAHHTAFQEWVVLPISLYEQTIWNYRMRKLGFIIKNLDPTWNAMEINVGSREQMAKAHLAHAAGVFKEERELLIVELDRQMP